jgi:basic membrane lipoprotein Med (substrate-binding protein (PBP1-ABC) superfamily)
MPGTRTRHNVLRPGVAGRAASSLRRHPLRYAGAGLLAVTLIAGLVYLAWPGPGYRPAVRARAYADYTACLLTDATGVTGTTGAPVWAGMRAASQVTAAQISYLVIQGPDTAANANLYVNTLALRGCRVIVATGALPARGVTDRASAYPHLRFITVASGPSDAANVAAYTGADAAATENYVKESLIHDLHE